MEYFFYNVLDSTMTEADRLLSMGHTSFCVIADTQTAGRGKPGRSWHDEKGGSLLISIAVPLERRPEEYSFAAGLAVINMLKKNCGLECSLKWVNDVYCRNRKLCGILCEQKLKDGKAYMIAGIGINVLEKAFPEGLDATSVVIENPSAAPAPRSLAEPLAEEFLAACRLPFGEILAVWDDKLYMKGRQAAIKSGNTLYSGVVDGIDAGGRLLLRGGKETFALSSGTLI